MDSTAFEAVVSDLRGDIPPRVWSLLVTVFGDLAQDGSALPGTVLGEIMSRVGIKPEAMRVALHRLRKDGWIESERAIVQPKLVLAMGASAARGMLGKTVSITKARGRPIPLEDGSELWVTAHPSYLLRLDGPAREEQARLFDADLAAVRTRLAELTAP